MASLKIQPRTHSSIQFNKPNPVSDLNLNSCLSVSKQIKKRVCSHRVSSSLSLSNSCRGGGGVMKEDQKTEGVLSGKIDEWMNESVVDIVKNLKQAPLLVQIFAEDGKGEVKIKTERAVEEDWPILKSEWEKRSPDGLIFVGELGGEDEKLVDEEGEGITKAWGVVVQGKGMECSPACYLLKTSRVGAGFGMGLFCTHFCLAKVQNFRDSALVQFQNSWLLQ
ncbi:hypothetical protein R3W88_016628 [Solanum pinnatisectum]|uniref:DUF7804 domain-containing protein n=1 Tax=Solanum pinnatisectum TaxID=50273 RepID=A0AAV9L089_9SOLN|nr:hypothetical protein R3W88_016628 [Solanum pinnatisectum]